MSGQGELILKDGGIYTGGVENGMRSGHGTMIYSQKSVLYSYVGNWLQGKKHGKGTLKWKSGQIYTGGFENGKLSGQGELILKDGGI